MQALRVLRTLKYLAEVGPRSPPARQVAQSIQAIMRPLQQVDILFIPHAVLGYTALTQSKSTSVETDVSLADISSLPLSVCSTGDMPQPDRQSRPGDYKSAKGEMMLESGSSSGAGHQSRD